MIGRLPGHTTLPRRKRVIRACPPHKIRRRKPNRLSDRGAEQVALAVRTVLAEGSGRGAGQRTELSFAFARLVASSIGSSILR